MAFDSDEEDTEESEERQDKEKEGTGIIPEKIEMTTNNNKKKKKKKPAKTSVFVFLVSRTFNFGAGPCAKNCLFRAPLIFAHFLCAKIKGAQKLRELR